MTLETETHLVFAEGADAVETAENEYVVDGRKFGSPVSGTFSGDITWSLATANFVGREAYDAPVTVLNFDAGAVIASALSAWAAVANLRFVQVADSNRVDIRFGMDLIDGPNNVLGRTLTTFNGSQILFADVVFDLGDSYSPTGAGAPISFYLLALHEIGHALGLNHQDGFPAVMNSSLNEGLAGLTADDIAGIQAIYGPSRSVAAASSPTVSAGFAALFDDQFYLSRYPDVAAAGIDPTAHYLLFGAGEGRDPDKLFDTSAYVAANPDVAAAGINPLEHYAAYGWREGRDPGPGFDVQAYLQAYPDVALVGIDPLQHYLLYGEAEGRAIFPAA
ncbi:MAG: matrixin family metalloprotease [Rhodospirillales bacterium]